MAEVKEVLVVSKTADLLDSVVKVMPVKVLEEVVAFLVPAGDNENS